MELKNLATNFAVESWRDAIQFTSNPQQIPLENFKLHFLLIMKVSLTNWENILLYFQNTTMHYKQ